MNVAAFLSKQPSSHAARRISSRSMKYARYPVAKLLEWRSAAFRSVFRDNRVVMLDLDEANNRIYVGVSEPSAVQPTLTVLEQHSVPMTAVSVEVVGDVELMQNIQTQQIRPTIGGIQIDGSRSGDECTLGATVMWDIENTTYRFMTASHCSPSPGQVDGERRDSPVYPNALIGYEIQDPPVFWDSFGLQCPSGKRCRHSDVAMYQYSDGVSFDLGGIARTQYHGSVTGSLLLGGPTTFRIQSETYSNASVGQMLNKVGRTTGWTRGAVVRSCADYNNSDLNALIRCQDEVDAGVNGGDSGAPVFTDADAEGRVDLAGILWARVVANGNFIYSPMWQIRRDFGYPMMTVVGSF